jgi:ArsR family transcriptional regulator
MAERTLLGKASAGVAGRGIEELSSLFRALSDETRLRILKLLEGGELCVCDIVAALGMSQPKVSFHLGVLKEAGLLKDRKEGRWMHYGIGAQDMFRRFLVMAVSERAAGDEVREDRRRLGEFLARKAAGTQKIRCCGGDGNG